MGKLITVWSPQHGQFSTTSSMAAIAAVTPGSVVTHTQFKMSALESMFGFNSDEHKSALNDTGINALLYSAMAHPLTQTDVNQASIQVLDNLFLLPSFSQTQSNSTKRQQVCVMLSEMLPKFYKNVFVDLPSGYNEDNQYLWEKADVNLVVLTQNRTFWQDYKIPNVTYVLSKYDSNSKYTAQTFKAAMHKTPYVIPYCTAYMDAIAQGKCKQFFLSNENILSKNAPIRKDDVSAFFEAIHKVQL